MKLKRRTWKYVFMALICIALATAERVSGGDLASTWIICMTLYIVGGYRRHDEENDSDHREETP